MAAVAAEPGAAAAASTTTTTVGDGLEYEAEPGDHVAGLDLDSAAAFVPKMEPCHQAESVDAVQECSQVRMEVRRPDLRVAGKALCVHAEDGHGDTHERVLTDCTACTDAGAAEQRLNASAFSPNTPAANNQVSPHESTACFPPRSGSAPDSDPEPCTVPSHSAPDRAVHEADPRARSNPESGHCAGPEHDVGGAEAEAVSQPEAAAAGDAPGSDLQPAEDAFHERPQSPTSQSYSPGEPAFTDPVAQSCPSDSSQCPSEDSVRLPAVTQHPHTSPEPQRNRFAVCASGVSAEPEHKVCADSVDRQPEKICGLVPGSEVRVSLDHIIDDALVVSFRLGEKIFSGVLMDLSKR